MPMTVRKPEDDQPTNRQIQAGDKSWFIPPPHGWIHPVTGRQGWQPDSLLLAFGQYVKRSRYMADLTQVELAKLAEIDQGAISRLERALAPAMRVERLVKLGAAMGRAFPLGYCPHEHWCQWQRAPDRAPDPPPRPSWEEMQVLYGLRSSSTEDPTADPAEEDDEPLTGLPPINPDAL
jgi:transcriptional regulator with XRE-family HTH domain